MKSKISLRFLVLFFAFVPLSIFGQDLNVFMTTDTLLIMNPNNSDPFVTDSLATSLLNNSDDELTLDIIRLENNIYPNWITGMCVDVCYLTNIDSVRISIPPNSSKLFKLYFRFFGPPIQSSADAKILFRNVSDPTNYVLQDYYAMVNGELLGKNEMRALSEIQIFPNPTSDQLTISIDQPTEGIRLILFDPLGKEVFRKSILDEKQTSVNLSHLTIGVYIYQICDKDRILTIGKLNKI